VEALRRALEAHRDGRTEEAAAAYDAVLAASPRHPVALANRAALRADTGDLEAAAEGFRRAREAGAPPDVLVNRGAVLLRLDRPLEAAEALLEACLARPEDAPARRLLARALRRAGDPEAAEAALREAIALDPTHGGAHRNLAHLLEERGALEGAAQALETAAACGDPEATHRVAAQRGGASARAPAAYLRDLFDAHAADYDATLAALEDRGPSLLAAAAPPRSAGLAVDLGCGTGRLPAAWRHPVARWIGVDLSGRMLAEAEATGRYEALWQRDVVEALAHLEGVDLVTAADVLCYVGDLAPVLAGVAEALAPEGVLVASLEARRDGPRLRPSGRFAHTEREVRTAVEGARLTTRRLHRTRLRREGDGWIEGWILVAGRS
jgi:predicted TPR repeat methyltransferase